jgi:hypothetical protein
MNRADGAPDQGSPSGRRTRVSSVSIPGDPASAAEGVASVSNVLRLRRGHVLLRFCDAITGLTSFPTFAFTTTTPHKKPPTTPKRVSPTRLHLISNNGLSPFGALTSDARVLTRSRENARSPRASPKGPKRFSPKPPAPTFLANRILARASTKHLQLSLLQPRGCGDLQTRQKGGNRPSLVYHLWPAVSELHKLYLPGEFGMWMECGS